MNNAETTTESTPPPTLTEETFYAILDTLTTKYLPPGYELKYDGIVVKPEFARPCTWSKSAIDNVNTLVQNIPRFFQKHSALAKKKYWNTSSSYGCKHYLSDMLRKEDPQSGDHYCSNGEFILACWILDYEIKPFSKLVKGNPLNATFNCTHRDLSKDLCECGIQYTKACRQQHLRSKTHQLVVAEKHENDTDTEFGEFLDEALERLI